MTNLYISGVCTVFNSRDAEGDMFEKGCQFVLNRSTPIFYNHKGSIADRSYNEDYRPIGVSEKYLSSDYGLYMSGYIFDEEIADLIKNKGATGLSTGIYLLKMNRPSRRVTNISKCILDEVSVCPFPMENECRILKSSDKNIDLDYIHSYEDGLKL